MLHTPINLSMKRKKKNRVGCENADGDNKKFESIHTRHYADSWFFFFHYFSLFGRIV